MRQTNINVNHWLIALQIKYRSAILHILLGSDTTTKTGYLLPSLNINCAPK